MTEILTSPPRNPHVLVVGGGIAGLSAALRLRALSPKLSVTILERTPMLGGKIAGEVVDGCTVDGGADVCIGDKLRSTHLFAQLGLEAQTVRVNPGRLPTYELRDGRLLRSPTTFSGELLTFPGGVRGLVTLACNALSDVPVATDNTATQLRRDGPKWRVTAAGPDGANQSIVADAVIVAIPARPASDLLSSIIPDSTPMLARLDYPGTTTVTMAWRSSDVPRPLDGTGYLAVDTHAKVSACTWVSAKTPAHAPAGVAVLRCYIRGTHDDAATLMRDEVATVLGITGRPMFTRVYRWDAGIPAYTGSHAEVVRDVSDSLRNSPGIFVAGSAFHGVGIPDCIHSGERAAANAVDHLLMRQNEEAA